MTLQSQPYPYPDGENRQQTMTEQQTNDSAEKSASRTRQPSSASKQQTTQKRPQRKNTERTASSQRSASSERASSSERQSTKQQQQSTKPKLPAKKAVVAALQQLQQLTTRTPESVIGIEPNEGGWRVTVEVVESARIPDTADIMAEYVVDIASDGDLASYKRGARYFRGRTREE